MPLKIYFLLLNRLKKFNDSIDNRLRMLFDFLKLLFINLSQVQFPGPLPSKDFVHRVILDPSGSYVMLWTPLEEKVEIEVQV